MKAYTKAILLSVTLSTTLVCRAQCPDVTIQERLHTSIYAPQGFDTAITCNTTQLKLNAEAFVTTQHFNGQYLVESIPYAPIEAFNTGIHLPLSVDDIWDSQGGLDIDFPFQFFGVTQNHVYMAANGLVSFNTSITPGQASGYAWDSYYPIQASTQNPTQFPWPNSILGVACDMDPSYIPSSASSTRGVFKYVGGDYPCRHVTVSWNEVPVFGHSSEQATYNCTHQVILYEGTNVIEVHVKKHRSYGTAGGGTKSAIGIINADGTSAFMAPGRNPFQDAIDEENAEAWRFTPQGSTVKTVNWYRMTADGDSIELGANVNVPASAEAQGHYATSDHLSCYVYPTENATYKVTVRYNGATGHYYYLSDIIRVAVDTSSNYTITSPQRVSNRTAIACQGTTADFQITFPETRTITSANWEVQHIQNGIRTNVPASMIILLDSNLHLRLAPMESTQANRVDSFYVYSNVLYPNGCVRSDSILYMVQPVYDIHYSATICQNQYYPMWGQTFNIPGNFTREFATSAGCDSVETLHLSVSETSTYIDTVVACREYTWINGVTYTESNSATAAVDTVHRINIHGCDSIVRLNFTLIPLEARIEHNPPSATIDRLNIQLIDVSEGADGREWHLPDGTVNTSQTCYFGFNPTDDSVLVLLHVWSRYGCEDDTTVMLHLLKESIWVPNVFTPKEETNNRFAAIGTGLVTMEMYIYDRRGEEVGHYVGLDGYWDGYNNSGELCPQGIYAYVLRYTNIINPNAVLVKRGTVTLIR